MRKDFHRKKNIVKILLMPQLCEEYLIHRKVNTLMKMPVARILFSQMIVERRYLEKKGRS